MMSYSCLSLLLRSKIIKRRSFERIFCGINSKNLATASKVMTNNPYKYLLILDFEATCDKEEQPQPQEIIEFPCLKLNCNTSQVESQFHQYVRPIENPRISDFCTELTGILQSNVSDQPNFHETLDLFHSWMIEEKLIDADSKKLAEFAFLTCGDWDIRSMLQRQCDFYGLDVPVYMRQWINIKKIFHRSNGIFPRGMMHMLNVLNIEHTGRHHSGIDDCRNIAKIVVHLLGDTTSAKNKPKFSITASI